MGIRTANITRRQVHDHSKNGAAIHAIWFVEAFHWSWKKRWLQYCIFSPVLSTPYYKNQRLVLSHSFTKWVKMFETHLQDKCQDLSGDGHTRWWSVVQWSTVCLDSKVSPVLCKCFSYALHVVIILSLWCLVPCFNHLRPVYVVNLHKAGLLFMSQRMTTLHIPHTKLTVRTSWVGARRLW